MGKKNFSECFKKLVICKSSHKESLDCRSSVAQWASKISSSSLVALNKNDH